MLSIEKETYINFNDAESDATLCTYNAAWLRKMDDLSRESPCVQVVKRTDGYGEYSLPKKWVRVSKPHPMLEENRRKAKERFEAYRKAKANADL